MASTAYPQWTELAGLLHENKALRPRQITADVPTHFGWNRNGLLLSTASNTGQRKGVRHPESPKDGPKTELTSPEPYPSLGSIGTNAFFSMWQ